MATRIEAKYIDESREYLVRLCQEKGIDLSNREIGEQLLVEKYIPKEGSLKPVLFKDFQEKLKQLGLDFYGGWSVNLENGDRLTGMNLFFKRNLGSCRIISLWEYLGLSCLSSDSQFSQQGSEERFLFEKVFLNEETCKLLTEGGRIKEADIFPAFSRYAQSLVLFFNLVMQIKPGNDIVINNRKITVCGPEKSFYFTKKQIYIFFSGVSALVSAGLTWTESGGLIFWALQLLIKLEISKVISVPVFATFLGINFALGLALGVALVWLTYRAIDSLSSLQSKINLDEGIPPNDTKVIDSEEFQGDKDNNNNMGISSEQDNRDNEVILTDGKDNSQTIN